MTLVWRYRAGLSRALPAMDLMLADRLKALKQLEDAGLISKEEAAAKRKEILKNL